MPKLSQGVISETVDISVKSAGATMRKGINTGDYSVASSLDSAIANKAASNYINRANVKADSAAEQWQRSVLGVPLGISIGQASNAVIDKAKGQEKENSSKSTDRNDRNDR